MEAPYRQLQSQQITSDTHLIRQLWGEGLAPVAVFINSMVITGDEPIVVDCGTKTSGPTWTEAVFSIVEPEDVRWIYLSHEDHDHTGNLVTMMDRCPNATLVTTWFMAERFAAEHVLPFERMRWVNNGERFVAGDREIVAVTPPVFDSPTTRGLFDTKSRVYWSVDSFGAPVTHDVIDVRELDEDFYRESFLQLQRMVSPWHQWLDPARFAQQIDVVRRLAPAYIANAHGATLHGAQIDAALELMAQIPGMPPAPLPNQSDLESIIAALTSAPAAA